MPQGERLGAGRSGDVRRERGSAGADMWLGALQRMDVNDVCVVLRVERSSVRSATLSALLSSEGVPWGLEECHMPRMLNPSCDGGPGSGAAGSWLVKKTVAVAMRNSKGELRRGAWPTAAAITGGCVNRRHARSNCKEKWWGQWNWRWAAAS